MTQYDYGWNDNWTWSTGSDSTGTSALSQPQHPAASSLTSVQPGTAPTPNVSALHSSVNVTDLETGETSRRTGTACVSVVAVMNSFGRPQGLPLRMNMMTCWVHTMRTISRHCLPRSTGYCLTQELQHIAAHWIMRQITHCYQ